MAGSETRAATELLGIYYITVHLKVFYTTLSRTVAELVSVSFNCGVLRQFLKAGSFKIYIIKFKTTGLYSDIVLLLKT